MYKNMRRPNTPSSQVQQKHTAPYFVSHLDSMSSNKLTSHSHYFQSVSRLWNLCRSSRRICHPAPYFIQSYLICYLSLCTSATWLMCEPCNVLQSGPRFDFIQPFFRFGTYADRLVASAIQLPMDLCNSFAIQPISFFRCKSKLISIQSNCKSQIPDSLFCFLTLSHAPTQNYTTVLLISQDTLQSLVVQDVQPTRPKVRKGNPPGSTTPNPSCSQTTKESATPNVGK